MATQPDIAAVRQNTNEFSGKPFDDDLIGGLIDELGVAAASAAIWRKKAATFAALVNVSEAGSSHSLGDLHKNALEMAAVYDEQASGLVADGATRVTVIDRE